MRIVVQRVERAAVHIDESTVSQIGPGLLLFIGITHSDTEHEASMLARKIATLRLFEDGAGKMNRGLADVDGGVLAVSQFTLYADCKKGRRPSFTQAARPDIAQPLYDRFCQFLEDENIPVQRGVFQAEMKISLVNDGPVTVILDTDQMSGSRA